MSAIQIPLSTDEWLLLSLVSRGRGLLPPEYLRDLLLKDLERNQHLAFSDILPTLYPQGAGFSVSQSTPRASSYTPSGQ